MFDLTLASGGLPALLLEWWNALWPYLLIFLGFSVVIFVHELGHFAVAKWANVRVSKFAIGFGRELFGFTRGETRYSFNALPLGGYVKMLGQEDFDDKTNEWKVKDDPRAFINKSVGARMCIVSAGVVMNVIFAAVAFMVMMMLGQRVPVPVVGQVKGNGPASLAGFETGDRILKVDGDPITDFTEVMAATMLAAPHVPLDFEIERGGEVKHIEVVPRNDPNGKLDPIGLSALWSREVALVGPPSTASGADGIRSGDVLVEINGTPVGENDGHRMIEYLSTAPPGPVPVIVERRADPDDPNSPVERVQATVTPRLLLGAADRRKPYEVHILGLAPLREINGVVPDSRADYAGLKEGDLVLRWGDFEYPNQGDILESVRKHPEQDIAVEVERLDGGRWVRKQLFVRPHVKFRVFSAAAPIVGIERDGIAATRRTRVGHVVAESDGRPTPAAVAGIPAGAIILKLNDQPVSDWTQMLDVFRRNAGAPVTVSYATEVGGAENALHTATLTVPHCIRTKLGLPINTRVVKVDGQDSISVEIDGRPERARLPNNFALREILKSKVGQTVKIEYNVFGATVVQTAELDITEDMTDPWLGQIGLAPGLEFEFQTKLNQVANPLTAIWLGSKKAYYYVAQVYVTMQRMILTRSVGADSLSGPVGIVQTGGQFARRGTPELLFFLGLISANLAVLNFLPLPIVDGGLMVFLIIEKIKRSPVSLKVQVATQVIGLVLIIAMFVMVTIQDLTR